MKLIAINVNNLTDARYLAARGVDTICFDTDKINAMEINAIKGWLDVPSFALQISPDSPVNVAELMTETDIDLCLFHASTNFVLPEGISHYALILENDTKPTLLTAGADWLIAEGCFEGEHIEVLSKEIVTNENLPESVMGFCVYGGNEERAGFMSFDDKDELLDWYEENYLYN